MNLPVEDDGPAKGSVVTAAELKLLLDDYYAARGWNERGLPTSFRLKELELEEYVSLVEGRD
jgi:aldehyde:ferredoxin oxidoreductase